MILPSKHITPDQSLLGVGAVLLGYLGDGRKTITTLWEDTKGHRAVGTFERFVLGLDLLFIVGAVDLTEGMVGKASA